MFHQIVKQSEFATGIVITFQVMAFTGMSPGHPDAVCAFAQGSQKEFGTHPTGAGNPDHPDIGWILHPADAGQVGRAIAAPVAQKSHNFWFPVRHRKDLLSVVLRGCAFRVASYALRVAGYAFRVASSAIRFAYPGFGIAIATSLVIPFISILFRRIEYIY
jgi:hypothetical protein